MGERITSIIDLYGGAKHHGLPLEPRPLLSDVSLAQLNPYLRTEGTLPPVLESPAGEENLFPFISQVLQGVEGSPTRFLYRKIRRQRLPFAITTGSDRDKHSYIDFCGGDNGERLAMIENGLDPTSDSGLVTYVYDSSFAKKISPLPHDECLLAYTPQALRFIHSRRSRSGDYNNGFAMFVDARIINRSVLAAFLPTPPLSKNA